MYEIFISTEYIDLSTLVLETIGLVFVSAFLIWLFLLLGFNKKKKSNLSIKLRLKLNLLVALVFITVLFIIYMILLYIFNGAHSFNWLEFPMDTSNLYLRIAPQIILFFSIIGVYINHNSKIKKLLKK